MKLLNPTDDELNAAFAEKVARWRHIGLIALVGPGCADRWNTPQGTPVGGDEIPRFTQSADAVLPWLEKRRNWKCARFIDASGYCVRTGDFEACDKSFPRAAVIALLRAHGVEIEFK